MGYARGGEPAPAVGGGGGGGGGRGGGEDFAAELARWAADARAEESARGRARERVLRQAAEEEGTFAGVVVDLAERGETVVVRTSSGRAHRGRIVAVGRDFFVVREGDAAPVAIALRSTTTVRLQPGHRTADTSGARPWTVETSLVSVLAGMAGDRPRVQLTNAGGDQPLAGELRAVGDDVATLRLDGERGTSAYVRLDSVSEVMLLDWG